MARREFEYKRLRTVILLVAFNVFDGGDVGNPP